MILTDRQKVELEEAIKGLEYGDILIKARYDKVSIEIHESKRIGEKDIEKIEPNLK